MTDQDKTIASLIWRGRLMGLKVQDLELKADREGAVEIWLRATVTDERALAEPMLDRRREGIAKAKGEGKYKGRAPTARAKTDEIKRLAAEGLTREAIAKQLAIGVASVYRALRTAA